MLNMENHTLSPIGSIQQFKKDALVIENAPLGVQAGVAAGIFTIAVNTGPLDNKVLEDAGANLVFPSMQALADSWDLLQNDILYCNKKANK